MTHTEPFIVAKYGGRTRKLFPRKCAFCPKILYAPKYHNERTRYCSQTCSAASQRSKRIQLECDCCGKTFSRTKSKLKRSRHRKYFCNAACKNLAQSLEGNCVEIKPSHYGTGESAYRSKAIKHYGAVCMRCSYNQYEQMLDVHHRDHNRQNNKLINLEVLCVWCHALETRKVPVHLVPSVGIEPTASIV